MDFLQKVRKEGGKGDCLEVFLEIQYGTYSTEDISPFHRTPRETQISRGSGDQGTRGSGVHCGSDCPRARSAVRFLPQNTIHTHLFQHVVSRRLVLGHGQTSVKHPSGARFSSSTARGHSQYLPLPSLWSGTGRTSLGVSLRKQARQVE